MYNFFDQVIGFLETFFGYLTNIIHSLSLGLETVVKVIVFPLFLSGAMPTIIGSSLLIVVALAVIKFVLGR